MDLRTISVVALSNRDYPSFAAKLLEAEQWLGYAAAQSAQLVVYPEMMNVYCGDGPANPRALPLEKAAFENWEEQTAPLRESAARLGMAMVLPLLIRDKGRLANVYFFISKDGRILGRFDKLHPTPAERLEGMLPGTPSLIDWDGVPVAGAICFDTNFLNTFSMQAGMGAKLFVIPSLWNGGPWLEGLAARFSTPMAVAYPAWSRIIDLDGSVPACGGYRQETLRFGFGAPVFTATLNFDREVVHLNDHADAIVEIQKQFGCQVRVTLLHEQAAFCIESLSPSIRVSDIMRQFQLTSFRNYLVACE
jgi:hypothetical protein